MLDVLDRKPEDIHPDEDLIEKINALFYGFMKEARRDRFIEFLEYWNLDEKDYEMIKEYFRSLGIKLG